MSWEVVASFQGYVFPFLLRWNRLWQALQVQASCEAALAYQLRHHLCKKWRKARRAIPEFWPDSDAGLPGDPTSV